MVYREILQKKSEAQAYEISLWMITIVRADSNFPNDMPCSISLNFTIDKIAVNFFIDSEDGR